MNDEDIRSISALSFGTASYAMIDNLDGTSNAAGTPSQENQSPAFPPARLATNATDHPASSPSGPNPVPTQAVPAPKRRIPRLRLTLPALDDTQKDRHAIVPFPATYQDAVNVALNVFSEYSNQLSQENIRLRCRDCTLEGNWIWADIQPSTWALLVQPDDEVGVFPKRAPFLGISEWAFVNGKIHVTYGKHSSSGQIVWSSHTFKIIDRPRSFEEAKKAMVVLVDSARVDSLPSKEELLEKKFHFFYFTSMKDGKYSTDFWMEFPPIAYEDDNVWRTLVPEPGQILGFMLE